VAVAAFAVMARVAFLCRLWLMRERRIAIGWLALSFLDVQRQRGADFLGHIVKGCAAGLAHRAVENRRARRTTTMWSLVSEGLCAPHTLQVSALCASGAWRRSRTNAIWFSS
jgi:hypothetical protein